MTNNDATPSVYDCYKGRAAVLRGSYSEPYLIESRRIVGDVGPLDVLVHIHYSGVCYGDLHSRDGGPPAPPQPLRPLVGGHEGVGVVVKLGIAVAEVSNIKIGDVVGLGWRHSACGKCRLCLEGSENSCADQVVNGLQTDGTFREYLVAPAQHVLRIPDGLDPVSAAPILCGGGATVAALRRGEVSVGKWVAISGAAGGLGHLAIQYAKAMGANVVAIDGPEPEKREFCLKLGADSYVDFTNGDVCSEVLKVSSGGVHTTLIMNSHPSSYLNAFAYSRPHGNVVALSPAKLE
ncbi:mannitol-1-phosphate dehydrogenase MPDH1 [Fusarium acutatum]|uniref:alcohol dehydrogenase n=1 Tax=Fusarium acutatum TaxID=78861 RepID=A0A8H4JL96_9HYPO|nr:mannitol-1-phosphate dehydrogenase MPDH1 [Fusarium acutatum]